MAAGASAQFASTTGNAPEVDVRPRSGAGPGPGTGTPYTSFAFKVKDDGGTAFGGIDLDPIARTMTIDVDEM